MDAPAPSEKLINSTEAALWSLSSVARVLGVAANQDQLRHEFCYSGETLDAATLVRAARYLGLKSKQSKSDSQKLLNTPLPAIARSTDGSYFVIARADESKVLTQRFGQSPQILPCAELDQLWTGELILVTKRDQLLGASGAFGFSWFIPEIIKYKKLLAEVFIASFFIQLFAILTPLFFQVMVDKVLVHQGVTTLHVLAIGMLAIAVFDVTLNGLRTYVFSHTTNRIDVVLGAKLFKHLSSLPISFFESRRTGETVARVRELETIRNFITGSALTLVIDLLFTVLFFAVLWFYSPTLTWIVIGSLPFYLALSLLITPVLRDRLQEQFRRGAENQAFLVESITGAETLKSMAIEPQMQRRWEDQLAAYVGASFKATNLGNIASQFAGFISKTVTVLILWIGATLVMAGSLTIGQLIAFNMIAGRISAPILRLVQLWQDFQQAGISLKRLGDILNVPAEAGHDPNRTTLSSIDGEVCFQNLSFRYAPDLPETLKGIDLQFKPGEVVGLVGRSGSGKSTLTKLIQRLYVPESGRILIDGIDIALVQPAWLRRQVGVVLQENFLFNRTVRENIALADPGLPVDKVVDAAKLAGAHEFISELPKGYDTLVGENGSSLSGGQKQRIAIARALITNPKILIFDEATSALDYESEQIIQRNMREICKGRTVFIVAHRLSAVRTADRIIVMDKGRVSEQGTHQELIESHGFYRQLYEYQNNGSMSVGSVA